VEGFYVVEAIRDKVYMIKPRKSLKKTEKPKTFTLSNGKDIQRNIILGSHVKI